MFRKPANTGFLRIIRTLFFAFLAAVSLFIVVIPQVLAQDQPSVTFKNTTLSVYPEYDDPLHLGYPSVLVMYDGQIVSNNLSKITFRVPSNASLYSAGSGPRSQYVVGDSLNRTTSNVTGWDDVSFIPRTNYFVVEYYAPIQGQPDRSILFEFRTLYPISGMNVAIQEPARSTNFKVLPEGTVGSDSEGFKIHSYTVPNVTADQPLLYNINYSKKDANPSTGGTSSNTTLILVVIGAIVVLGAVLFFLPQLRAQSKRTGSRSQRRQVERAERKGKSKNTFCRYCGKPMQDSDRFCQSCGKPRE